MTRQQRRAHLVLWCVLGPALLGIAGVVLLGRSPPQRPIAVFEDPEPETGGRP